MIPFFDEMARVIGPGGHAVFVFVHGAATPIYVPPERLRAGLEHGFSDVAELTAGAGTALVARRRRRAAASGTCRGRVASSGPPPGPARRTPSRHRPSATTRRTRGRSPP
jgi:hypothetical protein